MVRTTLKEHLRPLWIILSNRWGGPEQVAVSDLVEMAHAEISMNLICIEGSPVHAAAMRHPHIKVRAIKEEPRSWFDFSFVRFLKNTIKEFDANLVHVNDESLLWYLYPGLRNLPHVSVVVSRYSTDEASFADIFRRIWLRRIDYVVVLSSHIKNRVMRRLRVPERKIKVINLGLDFTRFDPSKHNGTSIRKSWGVDADTIVIGSVGRLVPEVGQDTFLKAAASLMKHSKWKFKFAVIGEDPLVSSEEYLVELRELAKQFRIEDHVVFGSVADNLPEIMSAFDVFVMPGSEEVPGLGALEALAMERPVVLSRVAGAEDIVGDKEEFGRLVRAEDAFDLQQKIYELLQVAERRKEMGEKGRVHVLKNFDKSTRFQRSFDVYDKCMKRRHRLNDERERE